MTSRHVLTHCLVPLVAGSAIYVLRSPVLPTIVHIPAIALMSGPGFLWMYATVSWVVWVWRKHLSWEAASWIVAAVALGPAAELSQRWGWVAGTFDPFDVLFNLAGAVLALSSGLRGGARCGDAEL